MNYVPTSQTMREEAVADAERELSVRPLTFKAACGFVKALHRHNKPPVGHKFSIGLFQGETLVGVGMASRPVARHFDDGLTLEVSRTCTDGTRNANSSLYGALWRAGKAMGYRRMITYTQGDESGSSLKGAGFVKVKELEARKSWAESSVKDKHKRDPIGNGGVPRVLWEIRSQSFASGEQPHCICRPGGFGKGEWCPKCKLYDNH